MLPEIYTHGFAISEYNCCFCKKPMFANICHNGNGHSCKKCGVVYWENKERYIHHIEFFIKINKKDYRISYNIKDHICRMFNIYYKKINVMCAVHNETIKINEMWTANNAAIELPWFEININEIVKKDFVRKIKTYLIFQ
jgi:hypothetical protein